MGLSQSHRCTFCNLAAIVSGGDDFGFCAKTQTRWCATCETLVDVCVEIWSDSIDPGARNEMHEHPGLGAELSRDCCPLCNTTTFNTWRFGDPCPRCGGRIEKTDEEMIDWDWAPIYGGSAWKPQDHGDLYKSITALHVELRAQTGNLKLPNRHWVLLSGAIGFDVRTGPLLIQTFRAAALRADDGLAALVGKFCKLADETGELPRTALFDPLLENSLRMHAHAADVTMSSDINWIPKWIETDL